MNTDKELLKSAAKAAGIEGEWMRDYSVVQERWYFNVPYDNQNMLTGFEWNPLADDGNALRLAVKRRLKVFCRTSSVEVCSEDGKVRCIEAHKDDPCAATRRAIVRAAAEIGRAL